MGRKDPDLYPEPDYPAVPNADAGEMDEGSLNRRVKRAVSQDDRDPSALTDVNSCTWVFRKGNMCKRMVIKIQYWVDGVRDCSKEYLQISGSRNINSPSDKYVKIELYISSNFLLRVSLCFTTLTLFWTGFVVDKRV